MEAKDLHSNGPFVTFAYLRRFAIVVEQLEAVTVKGGSGGLEDKVDVSEGVPRLQKAMSTVIWSRFWREPKGEAE